MRFIGNKENLLDVIYETLQSRNITGNTFFDFFSGTTNVGKFFKILSLVSPRIKRNINGLITDPQ